MGFSLQRLLLLRLTGSRHVDFSSCSMWVQQLWPIDLVASWHVESSRTRDRTCIPRVRFITTGLPGKSLNGPSFDRAPSGLAFEDSQSPMFRLPPAALGLGWALQEGRLRWLILSSVRGQQGQERGTYLPVGGDCCEHSRRVRCPGHVAHS